MVSDFYRLLLAITREARATITSPFGTERHSPVDFFFRNSSSIILTHLLLVSLSFGSSDIFVRKVRMAFASFTFYVILAMAFAFNLYMADVIIRIRQDIQVIRKRLGVAKITLPNSNESTSSNYPNDNHHKENPNEKQVINDSPDPEFNK